MQRISLFFTSFLLFVSSYCFSAQPAKLFSDSSTCFFVNESSSDAFFIRDHFKKSASVKKEKIVKSLLDSLGFFDASFSRISKDTVIINTGSRFVIDSLLLSGTTALRLDSVINVQLPRKYDAGEIDRIAKNILSALGNRGFPFANLSLDLQTRKNEKKISVVFYVKENGKYSFAKPLFTGTFKTSITLLSHDILFREGELFNQQKVLLSQKKLQSRPYISDVVVSAPVVLLDAQLSTDTAASIKNSPFPVAPPLDKVMVPFSCADKTGLGLDGALSVLAGGQSSGSTGLIGIMNLSLLNLFHNGESATVSYKGQDNYNKLQAGLSKPYIFNFPIQFDLDFGMEIKKNDYGYLQGNAAANTELFSLWSIGLGINGHEVLDSSSKSSEYTGVEIILQKITEKQAAGSSVQNIEFRTGSGVANNSGVLFNRWHVDFSGFAQLPFTIHHAAACCFVGHTLFTNPQDTLRSAELYRTGGYKSIRGYTDDEFSFQTVGYLQGEYRYYFSELGAVYVFTDAGIGFMQSTNLQQFENGTKMIGYGIGLRIPVKIGLATIEFARNYQDTKSIGRIHVSIQNQIASSLGN